MADTELNAQFDEIVRTDVPEKYAAAFVLPDNVPDNLRQLHREIVDDMRREAKNIPMNSVQTLTLERIAYSFIQIKMMELEGRARPAALLDANKQWREYTTEFNRQLGASHMKLREALLKDIRDIVMDGTSLVADKAQRREVREYFASKFEEIGE